MKNKIISIFIVILAVGIGLLMRSYQYRERFMYNHDNDLSSWIIKDIVIDKHWRLVGQLTSAPGIFIGPLYYYSLIPFYLLFGIDPIGGVFSSIAIGITAVVSLYYVTRRLYGLVPAAFASLLYAGSFSIVINERDVVPTTPVFLWTIWFYYAINRLFSGDKKSLLLLAVLFALVWHLNLALILLAPLVLVGILPQLKKIAFKDIANHAIIFLALSLPLFLFEFRHNFIQSRSLVSSLVSIENKSGGTLDKVTHVIQYASKNANGLFYWDWPAAVPYYSLIVLLLLAVIFLSWKKYLPRFTAVIYVLWVILFLIFFAAHPINLSEYYLNGLNILWIIAASVALAYLYQINIFGKIFSSALLVFLIYYNVRGFLTSPINHSGYVERSAVVEFIKSDALSHHYPCVSVSYMTDPGYNLGYRYLFWRAGLHVNQPSSGSPVYTIVFPHPRADRLDRTFGALGLILPDYSKYDQSSVNISCSGQDSNITDPMFGFTQ